MQTNSHAGHTRGSAARPERSGRSARGVALRALGALFLCAALSGLTCPAHAAPQVPAHGANRAVRANSSFTFADLDGDRQPDLATAEIERAGSHFTRYLIRLRLQAGGAGASQSIGVTGSFGLPQISALDVNGDHVPDLVVTASGQPRLIAVLLNDGRGRFSVANPSDFASVIPDSPWRWRPASGHLQDLVVLVLARAPQAEATKNSCSLVAQFLAVASGSAHRGYVPDSLRSDSSGRAPPLSI